MYSSLILLTSLLVVIPLTSALLSESVGYILAIVWVALMGVCMSILLTSTFGLLAMLPGKYTGTAMTGLAFSGVFIGTIRIITLGIWNNTRDQTTEFIGAIIYYVIAGGLCVGALFAYRVSSFNSLVRQIPSLYTRLHSVNSASF